MPTTSTVRKLSRAGRTICSRVRRDYAMVGYVLRNTLSDFGAVARGVCKVDENGFLEEIVELKGIERAGGTP